MRTHLRRRFDATPASVAEARRFVERSLPDSVDPEVRDELLLVASELATNTVRHAGTPFDVVLHTDGRIRIEVVDASPDEPTLRSAPTTATSGRGMRIVDEVCDRWGVDDRGEHKCVWCEREVGHQGG